MFVSWHHPLNMLAVDGTKYIICFEKDKMFLGVKILRSLFLGSDFTVFS
jgi:hypothetical protein